MVSIISMLSRCRKKLWWLFVGLVGVLVWVLVGLEGWLDMG